MCVRRQLQYAVCYRDGCNYCDDANHRHRQYVPFQIQSLQNIMTQILTQMQTVQTQLAQLVAQVNSGSVSITEARQYRHRHDRLFRVLLYFHRIFDRRVAGCGSDGIAAAGLTALGFYSGPVTGFYGSLTETAVGQYQTAHGIDPAGYVGPSTRAALNTGK